MSKLSAEEEKQAIIDKVTLNKPNKKKSSDCMLDGAGDGSGQTADAVRQYG